MLETSANIDSFLDGQGIPVPLNQIEGELLKLWGPAAEQVGGPELDNPHVTRIALANLVVESLEGDGDAFAATLETVIARFPCRAIVLRGSQKSGRDITAEVSALCHLPAPGLPQVCSERIVLRTDSQAVDFLPGAVRPLLETDLPMVLWWTSDPRKNESLFRDLVAESSRLILDLPDPSTDLEALKLGLAPGPGGCRRDAAWFGLPRWRELVAQFFDPPCSTGNLERVKSVTIEALSPDPIRTPRLAIWLAAWLAGQLNWKPEGAPRTAASSASGSSKFAEFTAPHGPITVELVTKPLPAGLTPVPRLMSVTIELNKSQGSSADDPFELFRLTRPEPDSPAVRIEAETRNACRLPQLVEAPELDLARRVAAALESSRTDPPFEHSLPIALWLLR
jgi:glucose-6-phosphate dehydrogenase assembly protein OpcA